MIRTTIAVESTCRCVSLGLILVVLFLSACAEPTTEPPPVDPGPDTTSHDFVWEERVIGGRNGIVSDISGVSPEDVWVVGNLINTDPNHQRSIRSGMHWDGTSWRFFNVPSQWPPDSVGPVSLVHAIAKNNVWFVAGQLIQWDGKSYHQHVETRDQMDWVRKYEMWGDAKRLYIVGGAGILNEPGSIFHYDYTTLSRITVPNLQTGVNDVWGVGDTAICVASEWDTADTETRVIRLVGRTATEAYTGEAPSSGKSIWFMNTSRMYMTAGHCKMWNGTAWNRFPKPPESFGFKMKVRGSGYNNILMVGQFGHVLHFNGADWKIVTMPSPNDLYYFIDCVVFPDDLFILGMKGAYPVVMHGRRVKRN